MLKSTLVAVLLLSSSAATAQAQAPAVPAAPVAPAPVAAPPATAAKPANKSDLERVVCKQEETIGTRLGGHKVCMTVAQWQERQRDVQDQMNHIEENIGLSSH